MPNDNRLYTTSSTTNWRNYLTTITSLETEANAAGVPLNINSCDVDPPFLHVDPPGKRAIIVRA